MADDPKPRTTHARTGVPPLPPSKRRDLGAYGTAAGAILAALALLAVVGHFVKTPKKHQSGANAVVAATPSRTPNHTSATRPPSKLPTPKLTVSATASAAPPPSAAAPAPLTPTTQLTFSGGIIGQSSPAINVLPLKKGANYDYFPPTWSTQCSIKPHTSYWMANVTVTASGLTWEIAMGWPGLAPSPVGTHPALEETQTGGSADDPNAAWIHLQSDQSPRAGEFGLNPTEYYEAYDHNQGSGTVTIDASQTSGTIDAWFTPVYLSNLEFHVTGTWSCTG